MIPEMFIQDIKFPINFDLQIASSDVTLIMI